MGTHEIDLAKKIVHDFHPLQIIRIEDIFSPLKPFFKKFRSGPANYHTVAAEEGYKELKEIFSGGNNLGTQEDYPASAR